MIIKAAFLGKQRYGEASRRLVRGDLCLQMTRDPWNQQCRELAMLKAYQALSKDLDRDLKKGTSYGCMEHGNSPRALGGGL